MTRARTMGFPSLSPTASVLEVMPAAPGSDMILLTLRHVASISWVVARRRPRDCHRLLTMTAILASRFTGRFTPRYMAMVRAAGREMCTFTGSEED